MEIFQGHVLEKVMSQQLKTALLIGALCGICLPKLSIAQDAKIAVVDVQALTLASDEGKTIGEKLDKRVQALTAEMDKARKDIDAKENDLKTRDRVLSAAAKTQMQRDIDDAKRTFDRKNQDYQKELTDMQNELLVPAAERAKQELANFVAENGYTLLIDLSSERSNVVWANQGNDVTVVVLKRINDAFKKSGGAAPTPAASPAAPAANTAKPATPPATPANPPARSTTPAAPPAAK
jgi:outer membrane protein